jgi:hypothetical protein
MTTSIWDGLTPERWRAVRPTLTLFHQDGVILDITELDGERFQLLHPAGQDREVWDTLHEALTDAEMRLSGEGSTADGTNFVFDRYM